MKIINESNGIITTETNIIGTNKIVRETWEKTTLKEKHRNITFINNECYGRISREDV